MALQLVIAYGNLRKLLHAEIVNVLQQDPWCQLLGEYQFINLITMLETAWIKDCIESTTLLMFTDYELPRLAIQLLNQLDRNNNLRQMLFRSITACDYRRIPEGDLTLVLRPSGLYLYL